MPSTPHTFIFAGGGTGGHIYPALAIAHHLRAACPEAAVHFLVSQRPLDASILSAARLAGAPVPFTPIPAQPFVLRPVPLLRFVTQWGAAVRAGRAAIRTAPGQVVLIAMGGFVAAPAVQAARVERIPAMLVNLDAVPGKANRWIARHVRTILTAARLATGHQHPAWTSIPPIVRPDIHSTRSREDARRAFDLDPGTPTLLVSGGSQGAASVNAFLMAFAASPDASLRGWQVIHQTGTGGVARVRAAYEAAGVRAWVGEFIATMGDAWRAADFAVVRAGAGNVAEAWATRTPALFLPYPGHRDQHQRHNAMVLVNAGGAVLGEDAVEPNANLVHLAPTMRAMLSNPDRLQDMRKALANLGPADGAEIAARTALHLAAGTS
ncbi:MAG: UDP-N-acetylglucosamine--N-acetylmuramyl-(pentapeptide) pyrophosphoryl-undecaprenol N-acetylglucosamine transferase [Phycisphaerae bacterium]|nr:MAG: UDP-N-acetylglucosamine--N-acetylmuramyl-(pentapeptide) pyrophosphoryl-undecaprenol N-acetylglucosamine transferase [Phycisphaerae bacterium]